jgi:hypothetical protein
VVRILRRSYHSESVTPSVSRDERRAFTTHPIFGDDLRALRRLQREQYPRSPFVIDADIEISYRRDIDECIAASAELQQLTGCRRDDNSRPQSRR